MENSGYRYSYLGQPRPVLVARSSCKHNLQFGSGVDASQVVVNGYGVNRPCGQAKRCKSHLNVLLPQCLCSSM